MAIKLVQKVKLFMTNTHEMSHCNLVDGYTTSVSIKHASASKANVANSFVEKMEYGHRVSLKRR